MKIHHKIIIGDSRWMREVLDESVHLIIASLLLSIEAVGALIIGFLRKDLAFGMLAPLGLSLTQLIIASVVLAMYFPCVATFAVLLKELGFLDMLKSALIMIVSAFLIGGILNLLL